MTQVTPAAVLRSVKNAIRHPYAWPGGYPLHVVMYDGEAIDIQAARENWRYIVRATLGRFRADGWRAVGAEINWEDSDLHCAHSGRRIESAYAEPDTAPAENSAPESTDNA